MNRATWSRRCALWTAFVVVVLLAAAPGAGAATFRWIDGYDEPSTPAAYDKVGILEEGSPHARNVLVLAPGTSASAASFAPLAKLIADRTHGWQVWVVERRENLLEDHSQVDRAKRGEATPQDVFDYYLGFLTNPAITDHFQAIPDADVAFARNWGMKVAIEDLRRVIAQARGHGRDVVLGGHSLGGSIATAYATWDFGGRAGASDLDGLVLIDGGSGPATLTADEATQRLAALAAGSPWLSFGGIPSPFAGLFNIVGSTFARLVPDELATLQDWPLLPANLKPPVPATSEAAYGYALDTETSPPNLVAAQVHAGRLAAEGDPRPLGSRGRDHADPASRRHLQRHWAYRARRNGVVPPAAADDRLGRGQRGSGSPRPSGPRCQRYARRRPAQAPDLCVRGCARWPARARCRAAIGNAVADSGAEAHARRCKRDVRACRPAVRVSGQ